MAADNSKVEVKIRIPGPQNFTPEQRDAVRELIDELKADGYDTSWPIRRTASIGQAILDGIGIYMVTRGSLRVINRVTDDTADYLVDTAESLLGMAVDWAKEQFRRNPREEGEPPRTTTVTIFGPDDQPLKQVEVTEDDDSTGSEQSDG